MKELNYDFEKDFGNTDTCGINGRKCISDRGTAVS